MLLILALISTLKATVEMYKATKQWQPNHYMQQFMKDGILYFLAYVLAFFQFHLLPSYSRTHLTLGLSKTLITLNC